jgi:hypothetical protein
MKFKTNLQDADVNNFEPLPPGRYTAEIIEASPEIASTGTPYLNLDFRILGPSHSSRHVWTKLFLTEKAAWKLAALLKAIGLSPAEELDTASFFNRSLIIVLIVTTDIDGIERNEIKAFRKIKPPTDEVATTWIS